MQNKALEAFGELREDEELGPADWATVKKYIRCLDFDDEPVHPHQVSGTDDYTHTRNIKDIRVRLLNGMLLRLVRLHKPSGVFPTPTPTAILCVTIAIRVVTL
jgi:hypothetical protein